jgi:butyryl-CoA dehydrogenase
MLTDAQRQVREKVRHFAQQHLAPGAAERDRTSCFARAAFTAMAAHGLLGVLIPEVHGGSGFDTVSYTLATMEIAAADGAASTAFQVHNALVCPPILRFGTDAQNARFLHPLATGAQLGAFCLTEPDAGSDAAALKTTARRRGNRFVLNGVKQFITSGRTDDIAIVFAVTDPDAGSTGLSAFIVPTTTQGYRVAKVETMMGQHSTEHCQIVFDDCEVAPEQMPGEEGHGLRIAFTSLESGRVGVAAQSVVMARSAYDTALTFAKQRRAFGKPIIAHQAVGFRLADMATTLQAAELMVLRAAQMRDTGQAYLKEASMAKLFASEAAQRICYDAMQTLGGYGYTADTPVERICRDVRVCTIYEGTSDIQRMVIARQLATEMRYQGL